MTLELSVELWYVDGAPMVEHGIQALKDALLGQIHLVDQQPVAFFDR